MWPAHTAKTLYVGMTPLETGQQGRSSHLHNPFFQTATQTDPIDILVLFGQFTDDRRPQNLGTFRFVDRTHTPNHLTTQLIDPAVEGSLAHYLLEMSDGALNVASINNAATTAQWYDGTARPTFPAGCQRPDWAREVQAFVRAVLNTAYATDTHYF